MPTEASHGRSNGRVPDSVRLGIFSRREYRCRPGLHRPGCGGSTPPSCRVRVASIAAMQRSLTPQSTGQHRGDPPALEGRRMKAEGRNKSALRVRNYSAFFILPSAFSTPMWLSSDSSSFVNCRAHCPTRVRVSPSAPLLKEEVRRQNVETSQRFACEIILHSSFCLLHSLRHPW